MWILAVLGLGCGSSDQPTPVETKAPCPRGTLDKGYCDVDGDLLADPPAAADQKDPKTLIFSYTPVEDPAVYQSAWQPFLDHLASVTGKPVRFFPVQSNAAQLEAMRAGRLHVAGVNTGGTALAVNCAGFVPFTMMASADGTYGYEMELITHVDSGITQVEQLKGKTLAFTSRTSNSGFKAPSAILKSEFGIDVTNDVKIEFSGKHDNSVLGVFQQDYDAAAIANSVMKRMVDRELVDATKIRSLYRSASFPTTAYGVAHDLKPELATKIKEAFASFAWEGTALKAEFAKEAQFLPIQYATVWETVRKIDAANGVSYDCR
ncbi:MAG: phosphate/phosphite/phosphonate ABC transporter substrate-binding protein [Myxococcota bacterium]